jgi:5-methylcytosine-specific restriction endonuclease McrA
MSNSYISRELRNEVAERAGHACEYCLLPKDVFGSVFHVDHIISEKQGGPTVSMNLTLACARCNLLKGSDISAYLPLKEVIVDLYNCRKHVWSQHFKLETSGLMLPISEIGEGSIRLLKLNESSKVEARAMLLDVGLRLIPNQ